MAEEKRTIHFKPAGSESNNQQQGGARPKQAPRESIFPDRQDSNANAANAAGTSAMNANPNTINTNNAATTLIGIRRGMGNCLLQPCRYNLLDWEEKQIWDQRADTLQKRVLPQLAPGYRPNIAAWRKAPDHWPHPGQTDADILVDWLKFKKQVRADEQFADETHPVPRATQELYPIQTLEECFSTCQWRIFLPNGFDGHAEEDIPPWLHQWCQHLLETTPKHEFPPLYCRVEELPLPTHAIQLSGEVLSTSEAASAELREAEAAHRTCNSCRLFKAAPTTLCVCRELLLETGVS